MRTALPGIRVIELASGPAGSIPGMVFADFGAEVLKISRQGDPLSELTASPMLLRMQERPAAAWMSDFIDNGSVAAAVYQTTRQALDDPDITANGHVIDAPDGGRQLGPIARLGRTPAQPGRRCRNGEPLANRWLETRRKGGRNKPATAAPLQGTRVIELATIIAAPLGASFLADMGAEVTKVEPMGGDPFRGLAGGLGAARTNAGKRSISLDLKSGMGRKALMRLLRDADVLIHNFRPGVPEKLGIAYEQVRALDWLVPVTHPQWGSYRRHGALVRFNNRKPDLKPPPLAGQDNEELLLEAGLSPKEIAALTAAGVLWQQPDP